MGRKLWIVNSVSKSNQTRNSNVGKLGKVSMQQHHVSRILKISSFVHSFSGSNRRVCSTHKKGQTGRKEALAPGNGIQPVSYAASLPGPTGARTPREGSGKNYIRKVTIWCRELTHWKRPSCWERLRAGGEGGNRG